MIIIGFLLAAAGAVFGLDLLWKNKFKVPDPVVFGSSLGLSSGRWFFLIGVIVGAAVVLGVALLMAGLGRRGAKAVSARRDRKAAAGSEQDRSDLQAENDRLRRQLDQQTTVAAQPARVSSLEPREGATSLPPPPDDISRTR